MSQCVPTWGFGDSAVVAAAAGRLSLRSPATSAATDIPMLDYEVAELTWENGQLALHGLGPPRAPPKAPPSGSASPWDKPRAGGTLESIVNQATRLPNSKPCLDDELVPWFDHHRGSGAPACGSGAPAGGSATVTMDALVPCSNDRSDREQSTRVMDTVPGIGVGCLTRVGSSTGPLAVASQREEEALVGVKRARVAARGPPAEWSVSGSTTFGRDSQRVTADTYEMDVGTGYTSTSVGGSLENTSSGKPYTKTTTGDDHDSVCHSRPQMEVGDEEEDKKKVSGKSSVSTKRSRAAAIHNQSERKRRDKINQRMKTLQKLVPNSSKTDKASMLDEVIEYLKQLQAQVNMMSRLNMPSMILPMAIQQQLQMSMMASPMGLGMGMGMGFGVMDINSMNRAATAATAPNMMANPFMAMAPPSWDGSSNDPRPQPPMMPDPMTAFLACPSQPMTMDAYSRMAALYQQMQQQLPQPSNPKS